MESSKKTSLPLLQPMQPLLPLPSLSQLRFVTSRKKSSYGDVGDCSTGGAEKKKTMLKFKIKSGRDETKLAVVVPPPPSAVVEPDAGYSCRPKRGTEMKREKFSVSLSRKEIEEDFMAILNQRPPRRPAKRSKIVQSEIDNISPGFDLMEVTADMYKVPDFDSGKKEKKKRKKKSRASKSGD